MRPTRIKEVEYVAGGLQENLTSESCFDLETRLNFIYVLLTLERYDMNTVVTW
jgi:hypothetical protein